MLVYQRVSFLARDFLPKSLQAVPTRPFIACTVDSTGRFGAVATAEGTLILRSLKKGPVDRT